MNQWVTVETIEQRKQEQNTWKQGDFNKNHDSYFSIRIMVARAHATASLCGNYRTKETGTKHENKVILTRIMILAARAHAAASLSPDRTVFSCFLSCKSQCFCTYSSRLPVFKHAYSHEFLLDVGRITFLEINSAHAEELRDLGLLRRPTPSPTPTTASRPQRRRYKRRERKQKRGKRGGIRARLVVNLTRSY